MGRCQALQPSRLSSWLRWLWPDQNPLRRACDRAEAAIVAGLAAALLVGMPLAALSVGLWSLRCRRPPSTPRPDLLLLLTWLPRGVRRLTQPLPAAHVLAGVGGPNCVHPGPLPAHRQVVTPAEPAEEPGDEILDQPQGFLVDGFGA
jgi:hypothetical protein